MKNSRHDIDTMQQNSKNLILSMFLVMGMIFVLSGLGIIGVYISEENPFRNYLFAIIPIFAMMTAYGFFCVVSNSIKLANSTMLMMLQDLRSYFSDSFKNTQKFNLWIERISQRTN